MHLNGTTAGTTGSPTFTLDADKPVEGENTIIGNITSTLVVAAAFNDKKFAPGSGVLLTLALTAILVARVRVVHDFLTKPEWRSDYLPARG